MEMIVIIYILCIHNRKYVYITMNLFKCIVVIQSVNVL